MKGNHTNERKGQTMASKKTFEGVDTSRVYSDIEQATAKGRKQKTASPEEIEQRHAEGRTRGKKGCHRISFTVALAPQNHEYLKVMSKMTGKTAGEFLDYLLQAHKEANKEVAEELLRVHELMKSNEWKLSGAIAPQGQQEGKKEK